MATWLDLISRDMLIIKILPSIKYHRKKQTFCLYFLIVLALKVVASFPAYAQDDIIEPPPESLENPSTSPSTTPESPEAAPVNKEQSLDAPIQNVVPQIPVPPQIVLPDPMQPMIMKEPLAWRAKAVSMSTEYPFNEKNGSVWVISVSYDQAKVLLKQTINQAGCQIQAEYPDAGQYLVQVPTNAVTASQAIIVSQPAGESKTLFKLRMYTGSKNADSKKIYSLPQLMKELVNNRGLLQ